MPGARARTLVALAGALASGDLRLGPGEDWAAARAALSALPGIGPWSVEMVALRGLGDPDAFPASDLAVRSGLVALGLTSRTAVDEARRRWRPWGAYAVQHLWCLSDHAAGRLPQEPLPESATAPEGSAA